MVYTNGAPIRITLMATIRRPDPALLLLGITAAALMLVVWWVIYDSYRDGPPHYTMHGPTLRGMPPIAPLDPAFAGTIRESLDTIPSVMGPGWEFDVRDERPDTPHILVVPIYGLEGADSLFDNCLNPHWRGSADLRRGIIHICADWWRDMHHIRHAVLHETIHIVGVGHYFGPGPNIMCSGEEGRNTCADMSAVTYLSQDPDTRAALLHLYGEDGWMPPNNPHPCPKYSPRTGLCIAP